MYQNTLRISLTNECNSLSRLVSRGPGYRLPQALEFTPLPAGYEPCADEVVEAVEKAYSKDIVPVDIVFDATVGEPSLRMQTLLKAAAEIKARRHGVPLTVETNGLTGASGAQLLCTADPGDNFGVKNLHVDIALAAHNPKVYGDVTNREGLILVDSPSKAFADVCSFVSTAAEELGSDAVTCTVVQCPGVDMRAARALANSLGAGHFESLPWHGEDLYDVLGLGIEATTDEIKNAYRKMAMKFHPDRGEKAVQNSDGDFERATHAYKILADKMARADYDASAPASILK
jgi:pyruvate-formate lyase-activating enzyme